MPPSNDAKKAEEGCAASSGPVSVPTRRSNGGRYDGENNGQNGEKNDDNDDTGEYLISTSVPTASSGLGAEPMEQAAMIQPAVSRSTLRVGRQGKTTTGETRGGYGAIESETETSPLLQNRSGSSATSSTTIPNTETTDASIHASTDTLTDAIDRPFLNNVSPGRFWLMFTPVLCVMFMGSFDSTIMASSHPVITSHFHAANSASWLSTAFVLTSTAFQPLLGRLSDAIGRKPLFLGAVGVFGLATLWCALAQSIRSFIAARAMCGLGAGGGMMMGSIIVSDLVPVERRGTYQSYINVIWGAGAALGVSLGGAMAETLGWRWEFGVQIPPLLLCMAIGFVALPADIGLAHGAKKTLWQAIREFDSRGSALLTTSLVFLILGLNLGGNILPWSHPFVITSIIVFSIGFPTFLWVESFVAKPIVPLNLIRESPRANVILGNFFGSLLSQSILFNIPLYFQAVLLTSATSSGLRLLLPSIVGSVVGVSTGMAITWTRRMKWCLVAGAVSFLIGSIGVSSLRRGLPPVLYFLVLVPSSVGQGFQYPGAFIAALACSEQEEQAVVTSTLLLWRNLGVVLGVASSSLVVQNALVHYLGVFVEGERKAEVIARVRASVEAVVKLEEPYREQVVRSYEAALRLTFICCTVMAIITLMLTLPVKLPRLAARKREQVCR